jgi:hypothetical protein
LAQIGDWSRHAIKRERRKRLACRRSQSVLATSRYR